MWVSSSKMQAEKSYSYLTTVKLLAPQSLLKRYKNSLEMFFFLYSPGILLEIQYCTIYIDVSITYFICLIQIPCCFISGLLLYITQLGIGSTITSQLLMREDPEKSCNHYTQIDKLKLIIFHCSECSRQNHFMRYMRLKKN